MITYRSPQNAMYRCPKCGWFRVLVDDYREHKKVITVPLYGVTTLKGLADSDIRNHNCDEHIAARIRLGRYLGRLSSTDAALRDMDDATNGSVQTASV